MIAAPGPATTREARLAGKQTRVDVDGKDVVLQVASEDIKQAIACLEKNGEIRFRFGEMRIRKFPGDMSFEPLNKAGADGGDGDGDGDGDGADGADGYDLD